MELKMGTKQAALLEAHLVEKLVEGKASQWAVCWVERLDFQ